MRSPVRRRGAPVVLAAITALGGSVVLAAPAGADQADQRAEQTASEDSQFGERGELLSVRPQTGSAALPSADRNLLVRYGSQGVGGRSVVVSGTVSLPKGEPPAGGWPVISWAHGTTGVADVCAPSADTPNGPAHDYLSLVDQTLDGWVARGFVVVQTDYEGLGTGGPHPYLNGGSAADTMLDIVRAARDLDDRVGRDWIALGHSQGGHAALFAAAAAQADDLHLLGAVAIGPGGVGVSGTAPFIQQNAPGADHAVAFLPLLLLGSAAADPTVLPESLLTDRARPLLDAARTGCIAQIRPVAATIPAATVFRPGADLGPLTAYLRSQEPTGLTMRVPLMVAQGTKDVLTAKPGTDYLVKSLCARDPRVTYRVYDGADHRGSIAASLADAEAFVDTLRAGGNPASTC